MRVFRIIIISIILLLAAYGTYMYVYDIAPYTYTELNGFRQGRGGTRPVSGMEQHGLSTTGCISWALFLLIGWWLVERIEW